MAGNLEEDLDELLDNFAALMIELYQFVIPAFLNGFVVRLLLGMVNPMVQDLINGTACTIPMGSRDNGFRGAPTAAAFSGLEIAAICVAGVGIFLVIGLKKFSETKNKIAEKTRSAIDKMVAFMQGKDEDPCCLMLEPRISLVARVVIPFLIFSNIALFISSNTSVGASVILQITAQASTSPKETVLESSALYTFGLVDSVHEMWVAGVYPLSILICLFSGMWPYLKLLALVCCWCFPARWLKQKWRGRLLMVLDMLGKWSLLDAYGSLSSCLSCNLL